MTMQRPNFPALQQAAPPRTKRMTLGAITRGRVEKPMRVLLVGTEGIGKSTFAAAAPAPIFLGAEDGTAQLDIERLPQPHDWNDVLDAVQLLTTEKHDFKTFVLDTVDWIEPLAWARVCTESGKASIEDLGYGKGYVAALDLWRVLLARLDELRDRKGMHVIALAHSHVRPFKNPIGDDYDRFELKLHLKAAGIMKEWADCVLFAHYEDFVQTDKNKRTRGFSSGARIIHTTRTAAWDAKNRYGLPDELPLDWDAFIEAVKAGTPADPAALMAEIETLLVAVDEETRTKAKTWLADHSEPTALAQMVNKLRAKAQEQQPQTSKEETNQ